MSLAYRQQQWTIGICAGEIPLSLAFPPEVRNPVLTARDVTDAPAEFVADPFMIQEGGHWFMFFEVMNGRTRRGEIGLATSPDGMAWRYERIVLREPFHLSYPYVFRHGNEVFMVPDNFSGEVRLYRASRFPAEWECVGPLIRGYYADPSLVACDGCWYLFAQTYCRSQGPALRLFVAEGLTGPWSEHPCSPMKPKAGQACRPGGRVLPVNGRMIRFAQEVASGYGCGVRALEMMQLTPGEFAERSAGERPVPAADWNRLGTHTVDPHPLDDGRWIACVDGYCRRAWRLGSQFSRAERELIATP